MPEIVTLKAAAEIAGVSHPTMLDWCRRLQIGELRGGRWRIDRRKLRQVIRARQTLSAVSHG